jgi:hypothetical protein
VFLFDIFAGGTPDIDYHGNELFALFCQRNEMAIKITHATVFYASIILL